jgi:hypothetical protein
MGPAIWVSAEGDMLSFFYCSAMRPCEPCAGGQSTVVWLCDASSECACFGDESCCVHSHTAEGARRV